MPEKDILLVEVKEEEKNVEVGQEVVVVDDVPQAEEIVTVDNLQVEEAVEKFEDGVKSSVV